MSENTKKCLVVGLPNAGKSTYIGAFWAIEKDGETGHTLTFDKYPNDIKYLNSLKNNWLEQKSVDRTVQISKDLVLDLKRNSDGGKISVGIPDFKGEVFNQVLRKNIPETLKKWIDDSDSILLFVENCEEDYYCEQFGDDCTNNETPYANFQVDEIESWIKVIQILKFLKKKKGDIRLSICVSAWDKTLKALEQGATIDSWLKSEHSFFYAFVKHQFSTVKFYGISAQGFDYENRDASMTEAAVSRLTDKKERAYISSGTDRDYDITKPLAWLLED